LPRKIGAVAVQELLHRSGGEDQAQFAVEDKDGVFQILEQVVYVAPQVRDFELGSPQALAEQTDFGRHHREFVGRGLP
jgi:hypothetical protein